MLRWLSILAVVACSRFWRRIQAVTRNRPRARSQQAIIDRLAKHWLKSRTECLQKNQFYACDAAT